MITANKTDINDLFILMDEEETEIKCLDHGFVKLIDVMGDDDAIAEAARVSYGKGTKTKRDNLNLIRYLIKHKHTSPLEMVEYKFHIKCPIFVARQLVRHRTASLNEISGRFSEIHDEYYVPELTDIQGQDIVNKQGRTGVIEDATDSRTILNNVPRYAFKLYQKLLQKYGVAREVSRIILPLSTYTEFYWKIDLHNLLHFLELRMDSHAQFEIRVFANAIGEFVQKKNPGTWEAWVEYVQKATTFSEHELEVVSDMVRTLGASSLDYKVDASRFDYFGDSPSQKVIDQRRKDLYQKLGVEE